MLDGLLLQEVIQLHTKLDEPFWLQNRTGRTGCPSESAAYVLALVILHGNTTTKDHWPAA